MSNNQKCRFEQWPVYRNSQIDGYFVRVWCGFGIHEFAVRTPVDNVERICRMLNQRLADLGYEFDSYTSRDFAK